MAENYIKKQFILILTWLLSTVSAQTWHQFGSFEYLIGNEAVNGYNGGNRRCLSFGARLAVVNSQAKQLFLEQAIGDISAFSFGYYIALVRLGDDFMWVDRTPFSYSNWAIGQPDNFRQEEYCATLGNVISSTPDRANLFKWRDVPCEIQGRYICQRKISPIARPNTQNPIPRTFVETTRGQLPEVIATNATTTEERTTTKRLTQQLRVEVLKHYRNDNTAPLPWTSSGKIQNSERLKIIVIPTVIVAGCLLVVLVTWIVWKRKRRSKNEKGQNFTEPPVHQTISVTNSLYEDIDGRSFSQSANQPTYDDVPDEDTSAYLTPIPCKPDAEEETIKTGESHYVDLPCFRSDDATYANISLSGGPVTKDGYLPGEHYDLLDKTR